MLNEENMMRGPWERIEPMDGHGTHVGGSFCVYGYKGALWPRLVIEVTTCERTAGVRIACRVNAGPGPEYGPWWYDMLHIPIGVVHDVPELLTAALVDRLSFRLAGES